MMQACDLRMAPSNNFELVVTQSGAGFGDIGDDIGIP
jgi:hypothetical protein